MATKSTSTPTLFDLYFEAVRNTEPPLIFHRWSLLTCVGAMLGRQAWIPFGTGRIFPNMYVMLIGDPGVRKSTAIKISRKILSATGYSTYAATKTSKEKFLIDLEGKNSDVELEKAGTMELLLASSMGAVDGAPRETFIVADEFNDFMRTGDLEFHSMLGTLWDWDDESLSYEQRLKNSRSVKIYQPTISLLGGNTHAGFNEMFPPQALGQGFISRMLLIFSEKSGKLFAFPEPPPDHLMQSIVRYLQTMRSKITGAMTFEANARYALETLYRSYAPMDDVRFASYSTRRYTHLLKLCILQAACRLSTTIELEDVVMANTVLSYAEHFMPRALGEFGKARNADVQQAILTYLEQHSTKGPVPHTALWKQVSTSLERQEDLARMLAGLQVAGKINYHDGAKSGKPGWLIVRKAVTERALYVNLDLLPEARKEG